MAEEQQVGQTEEDGAGGRGSRMEPGEKASVGTVQEIAGRGSGCVLRKGSEGVTEVRVPHLTKEQRRVIHSFIHSCGMFVSSQVACCLGMQALACLGEGHPACCLVFPSHQEEALGTK